MRAFTFPYETDARQRHLKIRLSDVLSDEEIEHIAIETPSAGGPIENPIHNTPCALARSNQPVKNCQIRATW